MSLHRFEIKLGRKNKGESKHVGQTEREKIIVKKRGRKQKKTSQRGTMTLSERTP